MKIYQVKYYDMTEGRAVIKTKYYRLEKHAKKAADTWLLYGQKNTTITEIDIIEE